jgi:hypothetical protein
VARGTHRLGGRVAAMLVPAAMACGLIVMTAAPAGADVASVSGGAFGVGASGLLPLAPTPAVSLAASGGGPYTASQSAATVPGLVNVVGMAVSTQGSTGVSGSAESAAGVQTVDLLAGALTVAGLASSCSSNESGSSGSTTVTELAVDGVPVELPNPVPPDFGVTVPGVGSVELNYQTATSGEGATAITVDALHASLVAGLVTVDVGESSCGVTYSSGGGTNE